MGIIELKGRLAEEITKTISSFNLIDDTGDKIDQCTITFNASRFATLPPYGVSYEIIIHGISRGSWSVISKGVNSRFECTLKLSPIKKFGAIKEKKTISYNGQSIQHIINHTVNPCGYSAVVAASLASKIITCKRNNESCGDFLNRLAVEYNAVSKPYDNVWRFNDRMSTKTSKGNNKPVTTITSEIKGVSAELVEAASESFSGVRCSYWDIEQNKLVTLNAGIEPFKELGSVDKSKASNLIDSFTTSNKNGQQRVSVTVPTCLTLVGGLFAESILDLDINRFIKGTYTIDSVNVSLKQTTIKASIPKASISK